jgi:flavin-dependent thymidylate synthase
LYITKPTFIDIETFKNESSKYDKLLEPSTGIQYDTLILDKTVNIQTTDRTKPIKKVDIGIDTDYIQDLIDDCDISPEVFFNIIPVTIVFKNMSRTATHQLVRHRNAITQESQRYVNAKNATFTIPVPDYDDSTKYNITLFGQKKEVDLFELANELLSVYTQLTDAGLKKEEARAYLPSNVNCGRLYMTFSLYNLVSFLKLRTDNHAQYEIRKYAEAIKEALTITLSLFGIVLNLELNT